MLGWEAGVGVRFGGEGGGIGRRRRCGCCCGGKREVDIKQ